MSTALALMRVKETRHRVKLVRIGVNHGNRTRSISMIAEAVMVCIAVDEFITTHT